MKPAATRQRHVLLPTTSSLSLWQQIKEAAVPLAAYWALLLFSFASFCFAVLVSRFFNNKLMDAETIIVLVTIAVVCLGGAAIGQVMAFFRLRAWIVLAFGAFCWFLAFVVGVGATWAGEAAVIVGVVLVLLPIAVTGGLWSLETNRSLWATWLPLMLSVGAVIGWAENVTKLDERWHAGDKWAIWDPGAFLFLAGAVVFTLAYLLARETHRLALWRRGPAAPLRPSLEEKGATRPRVTVLGCGLILLLAAGLSVATALISPYFWRTGPGDGDGEGGGTAQEMQQRDPGDGEPVEADDGDSEFGKRIKEIAEQMVEAGQSAASSLCMILSLLLLGILGLLIAWRPLRRLFLLRHLRDPLWAVPATTRIDHGWRLVEIALADAGVHARPGEDAAGLARRARPVLEQLSPVEVHGLEDAAEVADRVRFGLGVQESDLEVMRRFSAWAIDTVWERLDDLKQVRCMYRKL